MEREFSYIEDLLGGEGLRRNDRFFGEEWENAALQVLAPSVHPEGGAHL